MTGSELPAPIQRDEVRALLPPIEEQIDIVEATYRAMAAGTVEMPPKIGIHPRKDAFLHAMPAHLQDGDVAALKWVSGFPANPDKGLPYISGVLIVNDAETGAPIAIMDAAEITAARTAAASGVCVRAWAPTGWNRAALLGCGEQGRYHAAVLRTLNPAVEIVAYDPVTERAESVADGVDVATTPEAAVAGSDVIVTAGPIVDEPPSPLGTAWLGDRWLLIPIDFDFYVSAEAVGGSDLFVTDDVSQFEAYRGGGHFRSWREPWGSVGHALSTGAGGDRVVACNLGVAALDAAFAAHVLRSRAA